MKNLNKPSYLTNNDWELLNKKYKNMHRVIEKLNKDYPVQYLIGNVNFYGYEILVKKGVLIPRFETEELVEKTLKYLEKYKMKDINVLEIGTGTGCIPITLKRKMPQLHITSIDKSLKALRLAKKNIKRNKVEINLLHKNIFKFKSLNKYSLIISNPPYIKEDMIIDPKCKYEPSDAIYAKDDGLIFYKHILSKYKKNLTKKFILAFEIGEEQGNTLKNIAKKEYPKSKVLVEKDLSNRDRYLFVINV